jgi:3-deoxy-D-manno-octulosonic-acid transferase
MKAQAPEAAAGGGSLARALYGVLLKLLIPAFLFKLWWRGRSEPLYRHAIGERFGRYRMSAEPGAVWVHAVSLGETRASAALIDALRLAQPGVRLLLTSGTATGREAAAALLKPGDAQAWLPIDTPGATRRFLAHWQPAVAVLMETEVWPQLVCAAREAGVPVLLASARLSERSLHKGLRFAALLRPAMASLSRVMAQTEGDALRLREAGAGRIDAMGNLKFDMTLDEPLLLRGRCWADSSVRPLVLAASTREGEEDLLLAAWAARRAATGSAGARLCIVPRHPQRFDEVAARVVQSGFSLSRRSAWADSMPDAPALEAEVWLGDSLAEMPAYFVAAQVALLGGSFAPFGGQNLIEAALCGCPLLMGPHTYNFTDAARLAIEAGAAERVDDLDAAVTRALVLVDDAALRTSMAQAALGFSQAHRGAAARMAAVIVEARSAALKSAGARVHG